MDISVRTNTYRGIGILITAKEKLLFDNNTLKGWQANLNRVYANQYMSVNNNSFEYATGYNVVNVTVKVDGIAASAASVIAMSGDSVEMSPSVLKTTTKYKEAADDEALILLTNWCKENRPELVQLFGKIQEYRK